MFVIISRCHAANASYEIRRRPQNVPRGRQRLFAGPQLAHAGSQPGRPITSIDLHRRCAVPASQPNIMTAAALILTDNVASVIPRSPAILLIAAIQVARKSLIGGTCRDAEEGQQQNPAQQQGQRAGDRQCLRGSGMT